MKGTIRSTVGAESYDHGAPAMRYTPRFTLGELEEALRHRKLTRRERRALERLTEPRRRSA
jgi:hypothetical protein